MTRYVLNKKSIYIISILIILFDQITKYTVINLINTNSTINVIPYIVNIRLIRNTGAAFSLFTDATPMLGILSLCVSVGLIAWIWHRKRLPLWKGLALSFFLGGCVGNGIDRWRLGYVNDFIELAPINFPIFNVADIAINVAVLLLLIESIDKYNNKNVS